MGRLIAIDPGAKSANGVAAFDGGRDPLTFSVEGAFNDPVPRYRALKRCVEWMGLDLNADDLSAVEFVVEDQFLGAGTGSFPAAAQIVGASAVWEAEAKRWGLHVLKRVAPASWRSCYGITSHRVKKEGASMTELAWRVFSDFPREIREGIVDDHSLEALLLGVAVHAKRSEGKAGRLSSLVMKPLPDRRARKKKPPKRRTRK